MSLAGKIYGLGGNEVGDVQTRLAENVVSFDYDGQGAKLDLPKWDVWQLKKEVAKSHGAGNWLLSWVRTKPGPFNDTSVPNDLNLDISQDFVTKLGRRFDSIELRLALEQIKENQDDAYQAGLKAAKWLEQFGVKVSCIDPSKKQWFRAQMPPKKPVLSISYYEYGPQPVDTIKKLKPQVTTLVECKPPIGVYINEKAFKFTPPIAEGFSGTEYLCYFSEEDCGDW